MNKKLLIILSVFLLLIAFTGSVSAANVENHTLTQNIDEVVNVGDTDEILTVEESSAGTQDGSGDELDESNTTISSSNLLKATNNELLATDYHISGNTFADIQTAIDNAQDGDTIFLDGLSYSGSSNILVNKNVNFVGGSSLTDTHMATITSTNTNKNSFNIGSSTIYVEQSSLSNIQFVKMKSENYCGYLAVENCIFDNSFLTNYGYSDIHDSLFKNSVKDYYGAAILLWPSANFKLPEMISGSQVTIRYE